MYSRQLPPNQFGCYHAFTLSYIKDRGFNNAIIWTKAKDRGARNKRFYKLQGETVYKEDVREVLLDAFNTLGWQGTECTVGCYRQVLHVLGVTSTRSVKTDAHQTIYSELQEWEQFESTEVKQEEPNAEILRAVVNDLHQTLGACSLIVSATLWRQTWLWD